MNNFLNITKKTFLFAAIFLFGMAQYAAAEVEPYPSESASLISRVGSLVFAPTVSAITLGSSYVNSFARCENNDNTGTATRSCLDVQGTGSFSNIIANNIRTFFLDKTFIGPSDGAGPGAQTVPLLVANTAAENDSIMVSDLGRFNGSGQFEPVDTTTMRGVCADANGEFFACGVPESALTTCPLTFTDTDNNVIYPVVDVDGACWFGRDMERNQVTTTNANYIYNFMNNSKFRDRSTSTGAEGTIFPAPSGNELTADIVFVDDGGIDVVYSSSGYLAATSALPSPYASDGTYHNIAPAFESFLLNTCDWSTGTMLDHNWAGSENYYIIDFQVAQHNEALGADSKIKPTYNITCREYTDTGDISPSYNFPWINFDTNYATSNEFHVNVYTIAEPQMSDVVNSNSGPFVHVEDIFDYTCPTGWHVPRTAEWEALEAEMTTRAADEGTTFSGSTLATEMNFNPDGGAPSPSSGAAYEYRYYVRELADIFEYIGGSSSYGEVRRDGYSILTTGGDVTFDNIWQKRFASWRTWHFSGPYISYATPTTLFARVMDVLKTKIVYALPSGSGDGLVGKVRCVRGTELTAAVGGWGTCTEMSGKWLETYTISSCTIGGYSVDTPNCVATSEGGPVDGETRSCIPSGSGSGSGVKAGGSGTSTGSGVKKPE